MSPRRGLETAQAFMIKYQFTGISWFALGVFVVGLYHTLSDGDFSFLLTLGAVVRMYAFVLLLIKTFLEGGADGLSGKTLYLYLIAFASRLTSILQFEGYLPYDSSGDWLYQVVEIISLLCVLTAIYQFHTKASIAIPCVLSLLCCVNAFCQNAYVCYVLGIVGCVQASDRARRQDVFLGASILPKGFNILFIVVPVAILALIFHPNLNGHFIADYSWTFACYLETFALVPQLVLFQRSGSASGPGFRTAHVSAYISNWVFALGVGRLMHFFFWCVSLLWLFA